MEATARLDYVLFQLTPTRTRCDLVIFAGKSNEKLAYGLLQPFMSHLRSAKEQIAKGGYSVTLRSSSTAPWFTKGTLQRFVRFVSTPEVLERFVTIEREIEQIDNSIGLSNGAGATETEGNVTSGDGNLKYSAPHSKSKGEMGSADALLEENSKIRLQRVLQTRKAVLCKEQAMVFARALAAGFEMDNLDDLLSFSEAFGASRLREACLNFMDLCKKKNEDRRWRDEIAAMQAFPQPQLAYMGTSGIILAGEDNDPNQNSGSLSSGKPSGTIDASMSDSTNSHGSSDINQDNCYRASTPPLADGKGQLPMPWANAPQYVHNFQGPVYQQMPPYQGYAFPGMPYYPANMQWTPNMKDGTLVTDHGDDGRSNYMPSSRKKDRTSSGRGTDGEQNEFTEPSDYSSESDSSTERRHRKKHGKRTSKKVVIRNINYITSRRDGERGGVTDGNSSDENGFLDCDSIKQQVEEAVGSLEKQHRSTSHRRKRDGIKHLNSVDTLDGSNDQDNENELLKNGDEKKVNGNWDALQQLLMREESESYNADRHPVQGDEEFVSTRRSGEQNLFEAEGTVKKPTATDVFLVAEKVTGNEDSVSMRSYGNFDASEDMRMIGKKGSTTDEFLFPHRSEETEYLSQVTAADCAARSSLVKIHESDDWIVGKGSDAAATVQSIDLGTIDGDYISSSVVHTEKNKKEILDDSIMIQARPTDYQFDTQLRTDISMVSDVLGMSLTQNAVPEEPQDKIKSVGYYEPDDLYMVLDRGAEVEQTMVSWTPEIDYDDSVNTAGKDNSEVDASAEQTTVSEEKTINGKQGGAPDGKASSKDPKLRTSGGKTKPEIIARNRKPVGSRTALHKGKNEKEEEIRRRTEELARQRQKRIAERSAGTGRPQRAPIRTQTKTVSASTEEKNKAPKAVCRTSTIERLAAAKTVQKASATPAKPGKPKKETSKVNGALTKNGQQKTAATEDKKLNQTTKKAPEKNGKVNGASSPISNVQEEKSSKVSVAEMPLEFPSKQGSSSSDTVDDIKELHVTSSVSSAVKTGSWEGKGRDGDHTIESDLIAVENKGVPEVSALEHEVMKNHSEYGKLAADLKFHSRRDSMIEDLGFAANNEDDGGRSEKPGSPELPEIEDSTATPTNVMGTDAVNSRKKWNNAENSPKATKGLRKLLLFGRRG